MTQQTEKEFLNEVRPLAEALRDYAMTGGKAYGITDVKITISAQDKQTNAVEKGAVASVMSGKSRSVGITLYAGEKILSFSKNTMVEDELRDAVLSNMKLIHLAPKNNDRRLLEKEKVYKGPVKNLDLFDNNPPDQKAMLDYAKKVEAAALAEQGVKTTRSVNITKTASYSLTLATNGIDVAKSSTMYSASAAVIAEDAKGMQIAGEGSFARHFSDMADPTDLGKISGQKAVSKLGGIQPATAVMPIVLDHSAASQFFSIIYQALDGAEIHKGSSFFKDKLGQAVLSPAVTLVDDPEVLRGASSTQIDAAGLKTDKVTFIDKGVLKCFNATLREARLLGIEPTGREIAGGTTNSSILPGTQTQAELIADIKEGIYIHGFSGGSVNVNNGTHSRQANGVMIKDGQITNIAVDGFVVSGNLKEMFMNVSLANDTPAHPNTKHTLAAPTTRINGVTIAGR